MTLSLKPIHYIIMAMMLVVAMTHHTCNFPRTSAAGIENLR